MVFLQLLRDDMRTKQRHLMRIVGVFGCVLLAASLAFAQGTRGTIRGTVADQAGGVVRGANVALTDIAKGVTIRTVQTNDEGVYQFVEVEPATYNIVVTSSGFTEARLNSVKVEPNRNLQLDVALSVGGAIEEVTVTAAQELVDRETPTLGTTVDPTRIIALPLDGRNILDLALLQPGVLPTPSGGFGAGLGFRVNGSRGVENNITLDGSNNNEVAVGGSSGQQPRPDAVQEFRLLTSNFEAEFGRNTGAVLNVVTRSGGNDFHGNARIFYRPTFLSAARYFDQNDPSDRPLSGPDDHRRRYERKEVGGQIGGPIYFPHFGEGGPTVISGKNRAFFFVDYERRGQLIGSSRTISNIPTLRERVGDFSQLKDPSGNPITLFDPTTGQPFAGNQIPVSRVSPIAQYYINFLPTPSASGQATVAADRVTNNDYLTARTDFTLNDRQVLNVTFNYFNQIDSNPFAFGGADVPGFGADNLRKTYNGVVRHTYTLTPNIVNSLLLGYARNNQPGVAPQNSTSPSAIGFTGNFVANSTYAGPPYISLDDRGINLGNSIQGPQARVAENFQIQDSVSYLRGDHRFKFGFDGTKYKQDQVFLFVNQGILTYSGTSGLNTTNDDFADFLIGNSPAAVQFGANGERDYRQLAGAVFAQDTWRIRPDLTLSLGLRYEYNSPLTDKYNRVAYYRPGVTSQLLTSGNLRTLEGVPITVPIGGRAPNGLVFVGDPDPVLGGTVPAGGIKRDRNNFAPRVGFAYTFGSSEGSFGRKLLGDRGTVLRGGFGVYYGAIIGDTALQQLSAPGFNGTNSFFFPASGTLANPFGPDPNPNFGDPPNQGQITNPFAASAFFIRAPLTQFSQPVDPNIRTPYVYQYNLTLERGFGKDYVATVSYVGNRGKKLYARLQANPSLGTFFAANRTLPAATVSNSNSRRQNGDISIGLNQLVSQGRSYYDSFEAQIQKRLSGEGLLFQAAYTFSKSITDADTQRGTLDLIDRNFGRALSSDDAPHRFVVSAVYRPQFFKTESGIKRILLDGYEISGIYTLQSGTPFTVANPYDTSGTGGAILSYADLGNAFQTVDNPQANNNRAFNADAFRAFGDPRVVGTSLVGRFRRGTEGPNQFRARNGFNNLNLSLVKRLIFNEDTNLELRFEAFNALNHTQFGPDPDGISVTGGMDLNLLSPTFGQFLFTRESRVVQLGARFSF